MARRPTFRQHDLTRAMRAAKKAGAADCYGFKIVGDEIIVTPLTGNDALDGINPWDQVLDEADKRPS